MAIERQHACNCRSVNADCHTAKTGNVSSMRYWTRSIKRKPHSPGNAPMNSISDLPMFAQARTPEQRARSIRAYLQQLGSWYPYFALYLSSRIDLLPAAYCQEFALVPDSAAPLSALAVKQILVEENGQDAGSGFL